MKNLYTLRTLQALLLMLLSITSQGLMAGEHEVQRLSEPVEVSDSHEIFGAPLPLSDSETPIRFAELMKNHENYLGKEVLVETRIAKVCQKKGCFFIAQEGDATARVSFKDYSFFIPTDSGGKTVVLKGVFSRKTVTKKEAEHFSADLGESTSAAPESFEFSIVASAIRIPRA